MNANKKCKGVSSRLTWLLLAGLLARAGLGTAAEEEKKFPVFQVGTQTYTNVTVTAQGKKSLFIVHSTGMANVKVSDLSPEQRQQLGFQTTEDKARISGATAVNWVKEKAAAINVPQVRAAEQQIEQTLPRLQTDRKLGFMVLGVALLVYLFFSNCNRLICEKTNNKPGPLIWVPVLQVFPMLRAASMSAAWLLVFPLVPIVWCFKIAKARGKSAWVGLFLLLPVIGLFAYFYLAFSNGVQPKERPVVEVMCLETA